MKNDSFWAFACARLVDFVLWANFDHTEVEFLNHVHLGNGLGPHQEAEQIAHRFFEDGLIVLNDSPDDREVTLRVADNFTHTQLLDLYDGKKTVPVSNGAVKMSVPSKTARILVQPSRHFETREQSPPRQTQQGRTASVAHVPLAPLFLQASPARLPVR